MRFRVFLFLFCNFFVGAYAQSNKASLSSRRMQNLSKNSSTSLPLAPKLFFEINCYFWGHSFELLLDNI
jgi:hypothetical protein